MANRQKDFKKIQDELSAAIDALNRGHQPNVTTPEVAKLVAVAAKVKQAAASPASPTDIIENIVERVAVELQQAAGRKKRRAWAFGGAVSTVAAIVVLSMFNLWPALPGETPVPEHPPIVSNPLAYNEEMISAAESAKADGTDTGSAASDNKSSPAANEKSPAGQASIAVRNQGQQGQEVPSAQQAPVTSGDTAVPKAVPEIKIAKSASPVPKAVEQNGAVSAGENASTNRSVARGPMVMLALPDKEADRVMVEQDGKVIRQVYNEGQTNEVVITQRRQSGGEGKQAAFSQIAGTPDTEKGAVAEQEGADRSVGKGDKIQKVSITVGDVKVTVEGPQSEDELLKIAQSLEAEEQPAETRAGKNSR